LFVHKLFCGLPLCRATPKTKNPFSFREEVKTSVRSSHLFPAGRQEQLAHPGWNWHLSRENLRLSPVAVVSSGQSLNHSK
jgi:hypothetical protein